ncbi:MAG TPA: immunoglobulin domain-containing protein [Verrucomicrobiae bacterium]|jgi:hypothetical protein|nr:immunoglobulin domain-containing protein [Verrucomicrobiae bacterium]
MKKCTLRGAALTIFAGLVLTVHAQDSIDQSQFPTILQQPVDQCVLSGTAVTFSVVASNVDSYQWYENNTALDGQTNNSLTIPNVGIGDVGYYFASVTKGSEAVPTRSANLNVYVVSGSTSQQASSGPKTKSMSMNMTMNTDLSGGGMITVFGAPVVSGGGSGTCPGKYSGYVNFTKTMSQGWGWTPTTTTTTHTAADGNRSDTKVQYVGSYGDAGCAQGIVTAPSTPPSPVYRFTIYFPQGTQVPTNAYSITLTGFDP